jgi:hypothetical protein
MGNEDHNLIKVDNAKNMIEASNPLLAMYPRIQNDKFDIGHFRPRLQVEPEYDLWLSGLSWCYHGKSPAPEELLKFHNAVCGSNIDDLLWTTKDILLQKARGDGYEIQDFIFLNRVASKWKLIVQFMAKLELTASYYSETGDIFDMLFEMDDAVKLYKVVEREKFIASYFGVKPSTMNDFRMTATPTVKLMVRAKAEAEMKLKVVSDIFTDLADTDVDEENTEVITAKARKLTAIDSHVLKIATPIIDRLAPPKQKVELSSDGDFYMNFSLQNAK